MNESLDSFADRLDAIAEELSEMALDELKTALRRGDQKRPASGRTITQARRAIEKASHLLRRLDQSDDAEDDRDESDA